MIVKWVQIATLICCSELLIVALSLNNNLQQVPTSSVIRAIQTSSITSCYYECWDNTANCCGIGFLPAELNTKSKTSVTCHLIKCENGNEMIGGGEFLLLDVLVSFL